MVSYILQFGLGFFLLFDRLDKDCFFPNTNEQNSVGETSASQKKNKRSASKTKQ